MGPNVKPFTHWAIYKGYKIRFSSRTPEMVTGVLTTGDGVEQPFRYDPHQFIVDLPDRRIVINQYGWEMAQEPAHE